MINNKAPRKDPYKTPATTSAQEKTHQLNTIIYFLFFQYSGKRFNILPDILLYYYLQPIFHRPTLSNVKYLK